MHRLSALFVFAVSACIAVALTFSPSAQAQTFTVLHSFTGGTDGAYPEAGLSINAAGELFGTTPAGAGTVFRLANKGSGWILSPLFDFPSSGVGGVAPQARPIIGPDGTLYGTTLNGGSQSCEIYGCGVAYNVRPPASVCKSILCFWTENLPHEFVDGLGDGVSPGPGDLLFDQAGRLVSCDSEALRVSRTDLDTGKVTVLTDKFDGKRYNNPNDLTQGYHPVLYVGANSGVYMSTDNGQTWSLYPSMTYGAVAQGGDLPHGFAKKCW